MPFMYTVTKRFTAISPVGKRSLKVSRLLSMRPAYIFTSLQRGHLPYLTCRKRFETSAESHHFLGRSERCAMASRMQTHL
jgi:hypothetical protein